MVSRFMFLVMLVVLAVQATACSSGSSSAKTRPTSAAPVPTVSDKGSPQAAAPRGRKIGKSFTVRPGKGGSAVVTLVSVGTMRSISGGGMTSNPTSGSFVVLTVRIHQMRGSAKYQGSYFKIKPVKGELRDSLHGNTIRESLKGELQPMTLGARQTKQGLVVIDATLSRGSRVVFVVPPAGLLATWNL